MTYEDSDDRGVAVYEYLRQQLYFLDTLSSKHADITSHVLAREGVPFIAPLSRIWSEGQVKSSDYREDFLGMMGMVVGIMLVFFGFVMAKYVNSPGSFAVIAGMFAAGIGLSIKGWRLGRQAAEYTRLAQRSAYWAGHTISLMDDPVYMPQMLEVYFRQKVNGVTKIVVDPIGRQLIKLLPHVNCVECGNLSHEARNAIRRILTRKCKSDYGLALIEEVVILVGKLGMVEFVGEVGILLKTGPTVGIQKAAADSFNALTEIIEKQKVMSTLLRSSSIADDLDERLLRPASAGTVEQPERLLRPAQD